VQFYRNFMSQSSEFCLHNPLSCFPTSVYSCCLFHYRLSSETFGYTFIFIYVITIKPSEVYAEETNVFGILVSLFEFTFSDLCFHSHSVKFAIPESFFPFCCFSLTLWHVKKEMQGFVCLFSWNETEFWVRYLGATDSVCWKMILLL
jgi:hypothetical protein